MMSVVRPTSSLAMRVLDQPLALGVQIAGRLVQDQDRGILQDGPRDRHPLALAAGELDPPLADQRVISLRQPLDELVGMGPPRRRLHLRRPRRRAGHRRCSPGSCR